MIPATRNALRLAVGLAANLLFALLPVPEEAQMLGSHARNLGLVGMGWALLK